MIYRNVLFESAFSEPPSGLSNTGLVQREGKASVSQKATLSSEAIESKTEVKSYKDGKLLTSSKAAQAESISKTCEAVVEKTEKKEAAAVGSEKTALKLQSTGKIESQGV